MHSMTLPVGDRWWRPFKTVGDTSVIHVDLKPNAGRESYATTWLNKEERSRQIGYRYAGPRRQFGLCRAALRSILCNRLGCINGQLAFGASEYGKPYALVDGLEAPVSFNVSHSGSQGLIAVAPGGRLGIDVEERIGRDDLDGLASTMFSRTEQAELSSAGAEEKLRFFFDLWTIKEALLKAIGTGLYLNPSSIEVPPAMRHGNKTAVFQFPHLPEIQWTLIGLGGEDFSAAMALEGKQVPNFTAG